MPTSERKVTTLNLTQTIECDRYAEMRANKGIRITGENDFGLKDQIVRVVDYVEKGVSAAPVEPEPYTAPIC